MDDIPAECIGTTKNGKKYINFTIAERRSVGTFGETHSLYITRMAKNQVAGRKLEFEKVYIGSAQPFEKKED